jgi:hypothetical protein
MIPLIRLRKEQDVAGTYTVYFATNRMPETDATGGRIVGFGSDPGPIDGTAVRFGSADVQVTRSRAQIVADSLYVAPELCASSLTTSIVWDRLNSAVSQCI